MPEKEINYELSGKPFEYFEDKLCVKSRYIISGKNADSESLQLIGERGLQKRIEKGNIKRARLCAPNTPALIYFDTLPPSWKKNLVQTFGNPAKQAKKSLFEKHFETDLAAFEYYINYRFEEGKSLPDSVIEECTLNASVLNCVSLIHSKRNELRRSLRGSLRGTWEIVSGECNRFKSVKPHSLPESYTALQRKLNQYKKEGYAALIHGNFCNKSAQKVDETVIYLLNVMFAKQSDKPTATQISRQYDGFLSGYVRVINYETGEVFDPAEFPKLSQATITNYLAKWVNKAATHTMRSGDRQDWMRRFKPYHSMKAPEYAGSIISVDDRQPPFWYEKGKRVWMYGGIDLGSTAITCWFFGKTKESLILDFYRQMVRNYTEWGLNLPYELEAEISGNNQFIDTFLAEGRMFQKTHIEANNARGKRIEPYWKPLRYGSEKKREGWIARPNALSESNQAGPYKTVILPYDRIVEECLIDIENWNNSEHPTIKGKSRYEVLKEMQHPNLTPTNWRAFLPYLGYKTQTSCNAGIIRLNNSECLIGENGQIAFSSKLINYMAQIEGKDIDIYWLDDNHGNILKALVYLRGTDRLICEAVSKPVYHRAKLEQTESDHDAKTLMSMYVSSVTGFINSRVKEIKQQPIYIEDKMTETISDKFKISGLRKPIIERVGPVEIVDDTDINNDDDRQIISTPWNKGLRDRF